MSALTVTVFFVLVACINSYYINTQFDEEEVSDGETDPFLRATSNDGPQAFVFAEKANNEYCRKEFGYMYVACPVLAADDEIDFPVCMERRNMCDFIPNCPNAEDENGIVCLYYKLELIELTKLEGMVKKREDEDLRQIMNAARYRKHKHVSYGKNISSYSV